MSKLRDYVCGRIGLASRQRVTETVGILSKTPKAARRGVTEQVTETSAAEYIRGATETRLTPEPMPRLNLSFVDQLKAFFRPAEPPPPPPVPAHLCPVEEVTQFLRGESAKRGFLWAPPESVIVDWCRPQSPFNRPGLCLIRLWDPEYRVCIEKTALLELVELKAQQQRPQQAPVAAVPVWRPTLEEQQQVRDADARARTSPSQIVAEQNAVWWQQQREQAAAQALAEPAKTTAPA